MYSVNIYNKHKSIIVNSYAKALELAKKLREVYQSDIFINDEMTGDTVEHLYKC